MKLTSFSDYCLRVLIFLAAQPDRKATIAEIARTFDISENHLTKVVHFLGRHGWVQTVRGKGGGLYLGRAAADIRVGEVVRAAEGDDGRGCVTPDKGSCTIGRVCQLSGVLREALEAFYAVLDRYSVADITRNPDALSTILFMPRPVPAAA